MQDDARMPPPADDMANLDRPVTRRELREELQEKLQVLATKEDLRKLRDELRTHFDVVAESFKSQFGALHDWVEANTNSLATRVEQLENGHGSRLLSLEGRVTHLENRK